MESREVIQAVTFFTHPFFVAQLILCIFEMISSQ